MLHIPAPLRCGLTLALLAACGGDPTSASPGIRFLSGAGGSDTILAMRPEPLVVEVRDAAGTPLAGATVRFSVTPPGQLIDANWRLYLCSTSTEVCAGFPTPNGNSVWQTEVTETTDAAGVARVHVQHGRVAGTAAVAVTVTSSGLTGSTPYETLPGNLASITVSSADTMIYVGASYDLNAKAADRFGNARAEPVSIQTLVPTVATAANGRVTGVSIGRASFALSVGAMSRTVFASVPPAGRLLASPFAGASGTRLVLLNTDGTLRRTVATTAGLLGWAYPAWYPDGRIASLEYSAQNLPQVVAFDTTSGARSLPIDPAVFSSSGTPSASKASGLMYFHGTRAGVFGIYRANVDGSAASFVVQGQEPTVSPDGTRLAYLRLTSSQVVVRDLATGAETVVATALARPFWSPAGDLIAYLNGPPGTFPDLHVVRPDGTGDRTIATSVYLASSWSPDGQWIPTYSVYVGGVELVRVSDGLRLPIPQTLDLMQVSWRP